jgi:branched-chain amino acid transport system permease protein
MSQTIQYIIDGFSLGSLYALFALGIALVFGIMGLINFAHGELIMAGGYTLVVFANPSAALRILLVIVIVIVLALAMERVAFRPIRRADPETMLVTSFAVSFLLQSLAILIFGGLPQSVKPLSGIASQTFDVGGVHVQYLDVLAVATTVAIVIALGVFLGRTAIGVQMRAAAENFTTARLMGVKANTVIATAFALSGFLAAVACMFLVAQTGIVEPSMGLAPVLGAFIATIIGGLGSVPGAVLGGYLLGAITVALQVALPLNLRPYRDAFVFAAVIAILILRPQGLLVARSQYKRV